jgi:hypothetical protein
MSFSGQDSFTYYAYDGTTTSNQATVTLIVAAINTAAGEVPAAGSVSGSYLDTQADDGNSEVITEQESEGKPKERYSLLDHRWIFNVPSDRLVTFHANTWMSPSSDEDTFLFAYSTDGVNYTDMFTVTENVDTGEAKRFVLHSTTSGSVFIRVEDTDRTVGNRSLDTLYVDYMSVSFESLPRNLPIAPANLSATCLSSSRIALTWMDNANNESGFEIERLEDGANWEIIERVGADTTAYTDVDLMPGTTYYYKVKAVNTIGPSEFTNVASATTDYAPIDQTAIGEVTVEGISIGTLADTETNDVVSQALTEEESGGKPSSRFSLLDHRWSFFVQSSSSLTIFANTWMSLSSDGEGFIFAYSTDDVNYTEMFSVTAIFDDDSYSTFTLPASISGTVYIRIQDTDHTAGNNELDTCYVDHLFIRSETVPEPPAAPDNLVATVISSDQIDLMWRDNSTNEAAFEIERSHDGLVWLPLNNVGSSVVSYSDSGLSPGSTYFYRVRAVNDFGVSAYSNAASETTANEASMHIGGLDAFSGYDKNKWFIDIVVTIHYSDHLPVAGATVVGVWVGGASGEGMCSATTEIGQCTISIGNLRSNVDSATFTVIDVIHGADVYLPADSHDANLVNDQPTITVSQP